MCSFYANDDILSRQFDLRITIGSIGCCVSYEFEKEGGHKEQKYSFSTIHTCLRVRVCDEKKYYLSDSMSCEVMCVGVCTACVYDSMSLPNLLFFFATKKTKTRTKSYFFLKRYGSHRDSSSPYETKNLICSHAGSSGRCSRVSTWRAKLSSFFFYPISGLLNTVLPPSMAKRS